MAYRPILDSEVASEAPGTTSLFRALAGNPVAVDEGPIAAAQVIENELTIILHNLSMSEGDRWICQDNLVCWVAADCGGHTA